MTLPIEQQFKTELTTVLLTSPIAYIPHYHYAYVDHALRETLFPSDKSHDIFNLSPKDVCEYDLSKGKEIEYLDNGDDELMDLPEFFRQIADGSKLKSKKIFIVKGVAKKLEEPEVQLPLARFAAEYENFPEELRIATIIIVDPTPIAYIPSGILQLMRTVEVPLPDETEISMMLANIPISKSVSNPAVLKQKIVRSLKGLDYYQIGMILDSVLIKTGGFFTEKVLQLAQNEKMRIVKKTGVLDVIVSDISLDMIGGLDTLRSDIRSKAKVFQNLEFSQSSSARVILPKGILILGMPGCGKSMIAKAIANEFDLPLLRLDVGRLMGQYVGQSEENMRKALAVVEATNPCVLWIDEVEKAFAGSQKTGGQEDSLVVRLMGSFLTWMQERTSPVYIVATANDVMRPEFMRKGRFDEVYFVDFPKEQECEQILRKKIERLTRKENGVSSIYNFNDVLENINEVAKMMARDDEEFSSSFSGAEIECVVNTIVEKRFVRYLEVYGDRHDGVVMVTVDDFKLVIDMMSPSIMARQKGTETQQTSIERIRSIQRIYRFKKASLY